MTTTKINPDQFQNLKTQYYKLGRTLPLAFYGHHHTVVDLLKDLDDLRKLIIIYSQATKND